MPKAKSSTPTAPRDDSNRQDVVTGKQDLVTGLVYDSDGNAIIPEIERPDEVVQVDQIGAFRRVVYSDGSVATTQTEPVNQGGDELNTPIPLPGEAYDQTGTGANEAAEKPSQSKDSA